MKKALAEAVANKDIEGIKANLTALQVAFCNEYVQDFNGAQAVLRAGYDTKNARQMATQILAYPGVRILIDHLVSERASDTLVNVDYVINKIVKAIEKAEASNNLTAVLRGSELLAKHLGMFIERTEISGKDGEAIKLQKVEEDVTDFLSSIARLSSRSKTNETVN